MDIVIPDGNEDKFQEMGGKLGVDNIVFLYDKVPDEKKNSAYLATSQKQVGKAKGKAEYIISNKLWACNDKRVDMVFDLEGKNDYAHHRGGINQVMAKQLRDSKIKFAFNFSQMFEDDGRILGRMRQNARLCRKYNVQVMVASFATDPYEMRSPKDIRAWARTLGL